MSTEEVPSLAAGKDNITWHIHEARTLLAEIAEDLDGAGLEAEIVGSVAANGFSHNDLDISLRPKCASQTTFEEAISFVWDRLPECSSLRDPVGPWESATSEEADRWFVNLLDDKDRSVEFYFDGADFRPTPLHRIVC